MVWTNDLPTEFETALNQFKSDAKSVITSVVTEASKLRAISDTIYHYTDRMGLKGILETGELWLTSIFNLNDPSELKHGLSRGADLLIEKARSGSKECKAFAKPFTDFVSKGAYQQSADYFVGSFSLKKDDLGQWITYADNGRGYVVGFDTGALLESFLEDERRLPSQEYYTFPLTYSDDLLSTTQEKLVDLALALIPLAAASSAPVPCFQHLAAWLSQYFLLVAMRFKHPAYEHEAEHRFLQIHQVEGSAPGAKVRTRGSSLVRYRELQWRTAVRDSLRSIKIGPAASPEEAKQFARDCVRAFHDTQLVEIDCSPIPYSPR